MKSVKFVRTLAAMAAAVMAASAVVLPASAADSEAGRTLSALSTAASVADSSASTNISEEDEVQAIWISFLDLQKILSGQSESAFTANVREMYQNCLDAGLNTVIVQVRPYGDSFYPSEYFPWSYYAGGAIGRDPGFDPLQILLDEAHSMGLTFEAWVNPLRLMLESEITSVSAEYPVRQWYDDAEKRAENLISYGGRLYLNPASAEARQLVCDGVTEILENYDVDGIHIDDYFYPSSLPFSYDADSYAASGSSLSQADWRRANITNLVGEMYDTIKAHDPSVTFGISPRGIVEQDYDLIYADVAYWASHEGYCDYLAPQIYYGFEHATADYASVLKEWSDMTTASGVSLRIGLAAYKSGSTDQYAGSGSTEWTESTDIIARQIDLSRQYENVDGIILFRYEQIFVSPNASMQVEKKNFTALLQ